MKKCKIFIVKAIAIRQQFEMQNFQDISQIVPVNLNLFPLEPSIQNGWPQRWVLHIKWSEIEIPNLVSGAWIRLLFLF